MPSEQIAVRIPSELLAAVDERIASGKWRSRADAVRATLAASIEADRRGEIDRQIVEAYTRMPQTEDELAGIERQTIAMIEEEPW